ncbi:hypothetical protein [Acidiferrobacter sp.]|uniref:hypothetical protein n=1 Tax=Acidiferrobacter sp. TaxID=1872107 RepID=UPI00261940B3|nr:hypothetical protein [Acidiferrobacter sp.]
MVRHIAFGIGALTWAAVSAAQPPRIAPGEWRMTADTPAGPTHYSTCLKGGRITPQKILRNEGNRCRMVSPVVIHGTMVTVSEVCRINQAGGQGTILVHVSAQLRLGPRGRSFSGRTSAIITTRFGNVTEHQRIQGVRTGRCAGG